MAEKLHKMRSFILSLLFIATTVNYLDRGILAVLLPEIRKELNFDATSYGNITFHFIGYLIYFLTGGSPKTLAPGFSQTAFQAC